MVNGPLFLKEIKEQCLFTEDKHENKNHEMYEEIVDEFNEETLGKSANLVALSISIIKMSVMLMSYFVCLCVYCVLLQI